MISEGWAQDITVKVWSNLRFLEVFRSHGRQAYIPTKREFVMKKYSTGSFLRVKFGMKESTTGIASHAKFGLGMQRCNTISAIKNGARARQCRPSVMACVSVSIVAKNNEIP